MGSSIELAQLKGIVRLVLQLDIMYIFTVFSSESYFGELDQWEVNEKNFTRVLRYRHIISLFLSISFTVQQVVQFWQFKDCFLNFYSPKIRLYIYDIKISKKSYRHKQSKMSNKNKNNVRIKIENNHKCYYYLKCSQTNILCIMIYHKLYISIQTM